MGGGGNVSDGVFIGSEGFGLYGSGNYTQGLGMYGGVGWEVGYYD